MTETTEPEEAQTFYGRWARLYDLLARKTPGIAGFRRQVARACDLEPGDTVVEMGCGTGANLPLLRERVGSTGTVVGLDFTGPVLERARRLTAEWDNVHVLRADATQPPIAGPVDAVLATFVVGMLEDPAGAVDDWCDRVEPGGRVVLGNAARSRRWYAPVANVPLWAVTVLSTPPTTRIRYERNPLDRLDEKIHAAHTRLRVRADARYEDTRALGAVHVTGARLD